MSDDKTSNWEAGINIIPYHMHDGVRRYIKDGIEPGDFLSLILKNDFVHAAGQADHINKYALLEWATFLYLYAPAPCWGSEQKMKEWMKHGGLKGGK